MNKLRWYSSCAAAAVLLLLTSCPNPIDGALARKVEDTTPPVITILVPDPQEKNYFGSQVTISGTVTDHADPAGRLRGSVQSLSYEEQYNKRIHGSVTPAADGSFSFSFSTIEPDNMLSGTQVIVLTAEDWNGNSTTDVVTLYDKTTGPIIVVFDHSPADYNGYSSALDAPIIISGQVELPTSILTYDVEPQAGTPINGRSIFAEIDSGGYFDFEFNPVDEGVSGQLRFILKAFDGKDSSEVFILTDDPVAPQITSATVAADNSSVTLAFSEGVCHAGGSEPISGDFTITQTGGPAIATLSGLIGAPGAGSTVIDLGLTLSGPASGSETITITGAGLTDRAGNPLSPASISRPLWDKTQPRVLQVSSEDPVGTAYNAGDLVRIQLLFSEPITVSSPLTLALNVGAAATCDSGSGNTIALDYIVQDGQNVDPLAYTQASALAGAVTDPQGNQGDLTLPTAAANSLAGRALRIDTIVPNPPVVSIGDALINIDDNQNPAGVAFSVIGEAGAVCHFSLTNCTLVAGSDGAILPASFALKASATGAVTVSATLTDRAGNLSLPGSDSTQADITAPGRPVVSCPSPTNDTRPTWTWVSGGGGTGNYRYSLEGGTTTATTATSYTYDNFFPLSHGDTRTLYVWERDENDNWSESGSRTVTIDTVRPASPAVAIADGDGWVNISENLAGVPFTVTGESGATYAISIGNGTLVSGAAAGTLPATGFKLQASGAATVTVSVTLADPAGNTSLSPGTDSSNVDLIAPEKPSVAVTEDPPDNRKPTWSWTSGGGGNGSFRRRLDSESEVTVTETAYTPTDNLDSGDHILYVRERDAAGNWSQYGQSPTVTTN